MAARAVWSKTLYTIRNVRVSRFPVDPTAWLTALLVAILLVSGIESAAASSRLALVSGAELAPRDDAAIDAIRPEVQVTAAKPAPSSPSGGNFDGPPAALLVVEELSLAATFGQHGTVRIGAYTRFHYSAQPRAPPPPASIG